MAAKRTIEKHSELLDPADWADFSFEIPEAIEARIAEIEEERAALIIKSERMTPEEYEKAREGLAPERIRMAIDIQKAYVSHVQGLQGSMREKIRRACEGEDKGNLKELSDAFEAYDRIVRKHIKEINVLERRAASGRFARAEAFEENREKAKGMFRDGEKMNRDMDREMGGERYSELVGYLTEEIKKYSDLLKQSRERIAGIEKETRSRVVEENRPFIDEMLKAGKAVNYGDLKNNGMSHDELAKFREAIGERDERGSRIASLSAALNDLTHGKADAAEAMWKENKKRAGEEKDQPGPEETPKGTDPSKDKPDEPEH